jgi:hypothetical protein
VEGIGFRPCSTGHQNHGRLTKRGTSDLTRNSLVAGGSNGRGAPVQGPDGAGTAPRHPQLPARRAGGMIEDSIHMNHEKRKALFVEHDRRVQHREPGGGSRGPTSLFRMCLRQ